MNQITSLFVKLSILVALSCQVFGSEHFGHGKILEVFEDSLGAFRDSSAKLRRRQVDLLIAAEGADTNKRDTKADRIKLDSKVDVTKPDGNADAVKTDVKAEADGKKEARGKEQSLTKEEQLATKIFEGIIEMGIGLESVTSLASTTEQIVEDSKKVSAIVPKLKALTVDLLNTAPKKSEALNSAVRDSDIASEAIKKSLQTIEAKPEDANVIKNEFKTLENSFHQILAVSENVTVAAIPALAELAKNEDQVTKAGGIADGKTAEVTLQTSTQPTQAGAKGVSAEKKEEKKVDATSATVDKPIDDSTPTEKKGDKKAADDKLAEQKLREIEPKKAKPAELNPAEAKPAELEAKPAEEKSAEPKLQAAGAETLEKIKPIETGVVV